MRQLLDGVDAAVLLTMPALTSIEIVVDGVARELVARATPDGVIADGVRWVMRRMAGRLDPAPLVTHHMALDEASEAYAIYDRREALKIVLTP